MGLLSSCATRKSRPQSLWLWGIQFPYGDQMGCVDFGRNSGWLKGLFWSSLIVCKHLPLLATSGCPVTSPTCRRPHSASDRSCGAGTGGRHAFLQGADFAYKSSYPGVEPRKHSFLCDLSALMEPPSAVTLCWDSQVFCFSSVTASLCIAPAADHVPHSRPFCLLGLLARVSLSQSCWAVTR